MLPEQPAMRSASCRVSRPIDLTNSGSTNLLASVRREATVPRSTSSGPDVRDATYCVRSGATQIVRLDHSRSSRRPQAHRTPPQHHVHEPEPRYPAAGDLVVVLQPPYRDEAVEDAASRMPPIGILTGTLPKIVASIAAPRVRAVATSHGEVV